LENFSEFVFSVVPKIRNIVRDSLASAASVSKIPIFPSTKYELEIMNRPSVPDNIKNWQVFEDDKQIENFLQLEGDFQNMVIDEDNQSKEKDEFVKKTEGFVNSIAGHDILQLKNNYIPRGLVPLEELFDKKDVAIDPKIHSQEDDVEDCNIGTPEHPKVIKISKSLPIDIKKKYIHLMKGYSNVFAWTYNDLKVYDPSIIQHTIPIKEDQLPFKQKLRRMNPMLLPLIDKEVKKLFDAKIIVSLRFSKWVANLVPVRKKNGEICLCVDFKNLNRVSLKDNYPLPKMDHILQKVVGSQRMSMLDGFSGYN